MVPATLRVKCFLSANSDGSMRCMFPGPQAPAAVAPDANLTLQGPNGWVNFQVTEVHTVTSPPVARGRVTFVVTPAIVSKMKVGDKDTSVRANTRAHSARIVSLDGTGPGSISATLEVPVEQTPTGWTYKQEGFKIGASFAFETPEPVRGTVNDVTLPQAAARTAAAADTNRRPFAPWFLAEALSTSRQPAEDPHASDVDVRDAIYASRPFAFVQFGGGCRTCMDTFPCGVSRTVMGAVFERPAGDRLHRWSMRGGRRDHGVRVADAATDASPLMIVPVVSACWLSAVAAAEPIARA
jgi:hypothetical protein